MVAAGLRMSLDRDDLENRHVLIWGYRNVWFVFPPAQATLFIPCSTQDLDLMHDTFMACFTTQKKASFPSPHYDGPFSAWARQIQRDQRQMLGTSKSDDVIHLCVKFLLTHYERQVHCWVRTTSHSIRIHVCVTAMALSSCRPWMFRPSSRKWRTSNPSSKTCNRVRTRT